MPREVRRPPKWVRLSSLGFEFAASVAGLGGLGYLCDRYYSTDPWGVTIGLILGFVGGMYNLLRTAIRVYYEPEERDESDAGR